MLIFILDFKGNTYFEMEGVLKIDVRKAEKNEPRTLRIER